jgi:outer membrane immunogenic protein
MYKVAGVVLMIGMCCVSALGAPPETPQYAPLEVSFSYSYARANAGPGQCGCFNMDGGSTEVALHAYRALSAVVDLTGERVGSIGSTPGAGLSLVSVTVGPRYSLRFSGGKRSRYTPFVQGLVGSAHGFDGLFPSANGSVAGAASALAVQAGGGLDLTMNRHVAVHAIQADYLRTQLPNAAGNQQNLLRVSAGIVFRVW